MSKSIFPKVALACCSSSSNCSCVNVPANCVIGQNEGNCVSGYETCSGSNNSSSCVSGECCVNSLCKTCGQVGGGCNCAGTSYDCSQMYTCCPYTAYNGSTNACGCPSGYTLSYNGPVQCGGHTGSLGSTNIGCCQYFYDSCSYEHHGKCVGETYCISNQIQFSTCVPNCSATTPTGLTYTTSSHSLSWTAGTGGTSQKLYVSADRNQVTNDCTLSTSPGCIVNSTTATSPYSLVGLIDPGTVYYAKVVNATSSCSVPSTTLTLLSSCSFGSPSVNVVLNQTVPVSLTVNSSSDINNTTFTSDDTGIADATSPDAVYPYSTNITGNAIGATTVTGKVFFGSLNACSDDLAVNVITPLPWWQVKDSDISTNGDLKSEIPLGKFFGLPGPGGYAGVPAYLGTTNLDSTTVADTPAWITQSGIGNPKVYDYRYFANLIPADILANDLNLLSLNTLEGTSLSSGGVQDTNGYYWYKYDGALTGLDLTLNSAANLGTRKVILLVDNANFNINAPINLTDGQGFFMVIVNGKIVVSPSLTGGSPDLEGMYVADTTFDTGIANAQLTVRGNVAAYGGVLMNRDLGGTLNSGNPSEFFEYAPDQILLFPKVLSTRKINWKEVAP